MGPLFKSNYDMSVGYINYVHYVLTGNHPQIISQAAQFCLL